jgi:cysteine-rich repeat protein
VVAAAIALIPGMARQAHAAYDMSGRWLVVNSASGAISPQQYEVVQDSGTLSITTWSPSGSGTAHGTIDEGTGAVTMQAVAVYPFCGETSWTGSVAADSKSFTLTFSTHYVVWVPGQEPHGGHFECSTGVWTNVSTGSRCGNGLLDDGEACDDGNADDGDCCTATCTLGADGAACSDLSGCGAR